MNALLCCLQCRPVARELARCELRLACRRQPFVEQVVLASRVGLCGLERCLRLRDAGLRLAEIRALHFGEGFARRDVIAFVLEGPADRAAKSRAECRHVRRIERHGAHDAHGGLELRPLRSRERDPGPIPKRRREDDAAPLHPRHVSDDDRAFAVRAPGADVDGNAGADRDQSREADPPTPARSSLRKLR